MPLPCIKNGTKQCQINCKRTGIRCKNPAAYGCIACRMHGAHKSKYVLQGANHPQYKKAGFTKSEKAERRAKSLMFQRLEEIGWHIGMFTGTKTRGRKVGVKLELNNEDELLIALYESINNVKKN